MTTCPGRGQLERLLENRLVDTELDELEQHIEACAACQQTLDELSDTTNWRLEPGREVLITRDGGELPPDVSEWTGTSHVNSYIEEQSNEPISLDAAPAWFEPARLSVENAAWLCDSAPSRLIRRALILRGPGS